MQRIILFLSLIISANLFAYELGEELIFDLSYGFITAGSSSIKLNETVYNDSIDCLEVVSISKTNSFFDRIFKVRDRIDSIWDPQQNHSYKFSKNLREGSYRQQRIHYYYPEQNLTVYMKKDKKATKFSTESFEIPDNTHDILSAFYWARSQDFAVGDSLSTNVTVDGKSYRAGLLVLRTETIDSIFGEQECLVVEPVLAGDSIFKQTGKILIWLSNDERKIPLKIESKIVFGSFKAILQEVKNVSYQKK
jgi:hypothetical protein